MTLRYLVVTVVGPARYRLSKEMSKRGQVRC